MTYLGPSPRGEGCQRFVVYQVPLSDQSESVLLRVAPASVFRHRFTHVLGTLQERDIPNNANWNFRFSSRGEMFVRGHRAEVRSSSGGPHVTHAPDPSLTRPEEISNPQADTVCLATG
jgi:hypothetical protein